mgnify:CR=1 FL=1
MSTYTIEGNITLEDLKAFLNDNSNIALGADAKQKITANRNFLERKIAEPNARYYGINTGFGALCDVEIPQNQLEQLQANLVMSHACGMGDEVKHEVVKLMMLLKAKGLSLGYSGVTLEAVEKLIELYNKEVYPIIWEVGSLGASGDLAPLAHLTLPIMGMGWVRYKGVKRETKDVFAELGIEPVTLKAKEGLALLNGTQFMSSWGCYSIIEAERVQKLADFTAAVSVDAFNGQITPFHPAIQKVRNHKGQIESAENVLNFLAGSEIAKQPKHNIQDPYSFRCMPQVHGASKDAMDYARRVFKTEINSVTDNPNIFIGEDLIVSGGNFHGQPLALSLDFLGIALAELGSISERRTYQLISGLRGLPAFLVDNPGLNSGFMIPQYTAASIVSQNKQLATPASIDSIVSSNGQEDHVSMGANAATKCLKIAENLERILAIELMNASQAIDFRRPLKSSDFIELFLKSYRSEVPFVKEDRILHYDIENSITFLRSFEIEME